MISRFSPPVLYVSEDEDENQDFEPANPNQISYLPTSMIYPSSARRKRSLPDATVRVNPSIVNWSKRQRHEVYHPQPIRPDPMPHQSETINYNPNANPYSHINDESHSFYAFDWTNEMRSPARIYSNPIHTAPPQMSTVPPANVMNVVKQHLSHLDSLPAYPQSHKAHRYQQHMSRKPIRIPVTANAMSSPPPPLPLPLPTPTSSYTRSHSHRVRSDRNLHAPYSHASPPALVSVPLPPPPPMHHAIKPVYQAPPHTTHRPSSPATISIPISTPEIRRQPLNGTGILSAFYDSKCYRCNICKFKCINSSALLQHLFTHIFYCNQCAFYSYSHHHLYQHIFEKHCNHFNDIPNPKNLELLYITRCPDGTFALCMDSSPPSAPSPTTPGSAPGTQLPLKIPVALPKPPETINNHSSDATVKLKVTKRKPRQKKSPASNSNHTTALPEKPAENPAPLPSPSSSTAVIAKPTSTAKAKPTNIYVLMKHRRFFSFAYPQCLHSLTLEYKICQEHTVRHICQTYAITRRRKFKAKPSSCKFLDAVTTCLKSIVNEIDTKETNRNSTDGLCLLPNHLLQAVFPGDDLETLTSMLKLSNRYTKSMDDKRLYRSESAIRSSSHHVFILSSSSTSKNEQSIFSSLQTSITDADVLYTQTKLQTLPISCDNTHRFLKGHLNIAPRPAANPAGSPADANDVPSRSIDANHSEAKPAKKNRSSTDKNNNSITSAKSRRSASPNVIVLD